MRRCLFEEFRKVAKKQGMVKAKEQILQGPGKG